MCLLSALGKGISYVYAISFLFSKCSTFPASWGHGHVSISHTLILGYFTLKAYQFWLLVLEACRDVASGADRHLLFEDS